MDRCEGPVPKAATDPKKLHDRLYIYWVTNFADWDSLTEPVQRQHLRAMLFKMWTTDKNGQVMRPSEKQRRCLCKASWKKFWLNDDELDTLVHSVVSTYRAQALFV